MFATMRARKQRRPRVGDLATFGRTADRPWSLYDQPVGAGDVAAATAPIRDALGDSPRSRLEWLLDAFVYADLDSLSPDGLVGLFRVLENVVFFSTRRRWRVARPAPLVVETVTRRSPFAKRRRLDGSLRELVERWGRAA